MSSDAGTGFEESGVPEEKEEKKGKKGKSKNAPLQFRLPTKEKIRRRAVTRRPSEKKRGGEGRRFRHP